MLRTVPQFNGHNLNQWAKEVSEYLRASEQVKNFVDPTPVLLPHQVSGQSVKAVQSGVLMYDPIEGNPVFSDNGVWRNLASRQWVGAGYVELAGDTMTGELVIDHTGVADDDLATFQSDLYIVPNMSSPHPSSDFTIVTKTINDYYGMLVGAASGIISTRGNLTVNTGLLGDDNPAGNGFINVDRRDAARYPDDTSWDYQALRFRTHTTGNYRSAVGTVAELDVLSFGTYNEFTTYVRSADRIYMDADGVNDTTFASPMFDLGGGWLRLNGIGLVVQDAESSSQGLRINSDDSNSFVTMYHADLEGGGTTQYFVMNYNNSGSADLFIKSTGTIGNWGSTIVANASQGATTSSMGGAQLGHTSTTGYINSLIGGIMEIRSDGDMLAQFDPAGTVTIDTDTFTVNQSGNNSYVTLRGVNGKSSFYRTGTSANVVFLEMYSDVNATEGSVLQIQNDGDIYNFNGTYGTISDKRLKDDITEATSQLYDILAMRVINYVRKDDKNKKKLLGFGAQDMLRVKPGFVGYNEEVLIDGEPVLNVKESLAIPSLIKAFQELYQMLYDAGVVSQAPPPILIDYKSEPKKQGTDNEPTQ